MILVGIGALAIVSTVFGMMMAVAQDLPQLEQRQEYKAAKNSILLDDQGRQLAVLTGYENRILLNSPDISSNVKRAVVAIEDKRFYSHKGVDYQGIARALWADVRQARASQGASTITQQFVKNALLAQHNRSVFQKLKEAALAYQLERNWSKDKILTQYLNTVYFGEGAYGIESAARVYFGWAHPDCVPRCAAVLDPAESALLAGVIASPAAYAPTQNPNDAQQRRNFVLKLMLDQGLIPGEEYRAAVREALPARENIRPPTTDLSQAPYFSSWMQQQLVDRYGAGTAFAGGLKVRTTLDLDYQKAAEQAVSQNVGGAGPSAALVAIDNKSGGIRAMVGGADFNKIPFNLATQGHRQPGSAFKPFTLIAALQGLGGRKYTLNDSFASRQKTIGGYVVNNYQDQYAGTASLAQATAQSDNSVFAELGIIRVGVKNVARMAYKMGIKTPLSENGAMILGGLKYGVSPLEMAGAFEPIANNGERISGTFAADKYGPISYTKVEGPGIDEQSHIRKKRVFPYQVGQDAKTALAGVVNGGTGRSAALGDGEFLAGKTGTTEDYGDAWFVGFNDYMTVAIWVGYPDKVRPMETEYGGEPVAGGTYPADIFRDFMTSVNSVRDQRAANKGKTPDELTLPGSGTGPDGEGGGSQDSEKGTSERQGGRDQGGGRTPDQGGGAPQQNEPAPSPSPGGGGGAPTPDAPPVSPPSGDGGSGGADAQSLRDAPRAVRREVADRRRRR
ncbi:MAG: transglycosylase domain-containing protein [Solirubrobacterales bacterium]